MRMLSVNERKKKLWNCNPFSHYLALPNSSQDIQDIYFIFESFVIHDMFAIFFFFFFENEFPFKIDLDGIHESLNISKNFIWSPFSLNYFGAKFVTNRLGFFIVQLNSFFNSLFCIIKIVPEINSVSVFC